jgi:hypothetical protein
VILINARCDVDEVVVRDEFHQWPKSVKCVQGDTRHILDCDIQLVVIILEDGIGLPLLVHVTGIPQRIELHG